MSEPIPPEAEPQPVEPQSQELQPQEVQERRREPVFNLPPVVLVVIGICVIVYLLQQYVLNDTQNMTLLYDGAFIPVLYTGQYGFDWFLLTRPFTYAFMHGNLTHIAINMVWLAAFGSPLAYRIGAFRFALFYAVTGLASVALFWALHPYGEAPLVGASGAISGMMGAAARYGFHVDRSSGRAAFIGEPLPIMVALRSRRVMVFLGVLMLANLAIGLFGFAPGANGQVAWEAHIGGLIAGFFYLQFFDRPLPAAQ